MQMRSGVIKPISFQNVTHCHLEIRWGHNVTNIDKEGINTYVSTRHVFVKHGCPRWLQSRNMAKISKSYILTPPHLQRRVMSVKCEEPIDELTVQVWLYILYHHPNFKYFTL